MMNNILKVFILSILEYVVVPGFAGFILWMLVVLVYPPALAFPFWKVVVGSSLIRLFLEVFNYIMDSIHGKN